MGLLATLGSILGYTFVCLLVLYIILYIMSHFVYFRKNKENRDVVEKVIIITGGTSGIGKEVVKTLYLKGAVIVFTGRSIKKAREIINELKSDLPKLAKKNNDDTQLVSNRIEDLNSGTWESDNRHFSSKYLYFRSFDQSSLTEVKSFTDWFRGNFNSLDTLHCNAGLIVQKEKKTEQGFDFSMGVTHFAHYLMVHEFLDLLKGTPESRVVTTSSEVHRNRSRDNVEIDLQDFDWKKSHTKYNSFHRYSCSKLANVLFTVGLADLFNRKGWQVKAVSLHPGVVRTGLWREVNGCLKVIASIFMPLLWTSWEGSQNSLFLILSPWSKLKNGEYYVRCKVEKMNSRARREAYWKKFWNVSKQEMKFKGGFDCERFESFEIEDERRGLQ